MLKDVLNGELDEEEFIKRCTEGVSEEIYEILIFAQAAQYIAHLYGDIQQPLHATTLNPDMYGDGDQGGNLLSVTFQGEVVKLHRLMDKIVLYDVEKLNKVVNDHDKGQEHSDAYRKFAEVLYESHGNDAKKSREYEELNLAKEKQPEHFFQKLAEESHEYGKTNVYTDFLLLVKDEDKDIENVYYDKVYEKDIIKKVIKVKRDINLGFSHNPYLKENDHVKELEYITNIKKMMQRRLVLGGLRLADFWLQAFSRNPVLIKQKRRFKKFK
jgi:hypothetical protein